MSNKATINEDSSDTIEFVSCKLEQQEEWPCANCDIEKLVWDCNLFELEPGEILGQLDPLAVDDTNSGFIDDYSADLTNSENISVEFPDNILQLASIKNKLTEEIGSTGT